MTSSIELSTHLPTASGSAMAPRIAIVGAGLSGLAAAWYTERLLPCAQVDLFEADSKVGGVIQTLRPDPYLVEMAADNFATLVPDALRMVEDMNLRDEFFSPKPEHRMAQVVRDGQVYPIPSGFSLMQPTRLSSILTSPILSLSGRMRVLGEFFVKRRTNDEDESVEAFAVRRLGRECFDRLVEPIVGGIFTARSETLSMQAAMPQFVEMERQYGGLLRAAFAKRRQQTRAERSARQATGVRYDQFLAPKQGMTWWLHAIAQSLRQNVRLQHRIVDLHQNTDRSWTITYQSPQGSRQETYHAICLALPSYRASQLIKQARPKVASSLERIPYASSAIAVLAIPRHEIRSEAFCFGIIVPQVEHRDSLAISLSSEKYEGRCPGDTVLVRVFMGGAVRPEMLDKSDDELLGIAQKEVKALLGAESLPRWQTLVRWNEAMPQYLIGHNSLIRSIRQELSSDPTIRIIGNAFDGVGIPQCIRLARQTAEHFAASLSAPSEALAAIQ